MRFLLAGFGAIAGAITVALVARYGFVTADSAIDGYITAFLFGTIALGGLAGYAVAARLWEKSRPAAWIVGVIATVALVVNLTNSRRDRLARRKADGGADEKRE